MVSQGFCDKHTRGCSRNPNLYCNTIISHNHIISHQTIFLTRWRGCQLRILYLCIREKVHRIEIGYEGQSNQKTFFNPFILFTVSVVSSYPLNRWPIRIHNGPGKEAQHSQRHYAGGALTAVQQRITTFQDAPEEIWKIYLWKHTEWS